VIASFASLAIVCLAFHLLLALDWRIDGFRALLSTLTKRFLSKLPHVYR